MAPMERLYKSNDEGQGSVRKALYMIPCMSIAVHDLTRYCMDVYITIDN